MDCYNTTNNTSTLLHLVNIVINSYIQVCNIELASLTRFGVILHAHTLYNSVVTVVSCSSSC